MDYSVNIIANLGGDQWQVEVLKQRIINQTPPVSPKPN